MKEFSFEKAEFSEYEDAIVINPILIRSLIDSEKIRILDFGCGTGASLININNILPKSECIGVDISAENIKLANKKLQQHERGSKVDFFHANYLTFQTQPFDLIYAESVIHLLPKKTGIFKKLSNDLKNDGLLVITIPDDCLYNKILILIRYLLKLFRSSYLDKIVFYLARLAYPKLNTKILKDRIPYMYMIPSVLNTTNLHHKLQKYFNLTLIQNYRCVTSSIFKPKHNLVIFKKQSSD